MLTINNEPIYKQGNGYIIQHKGAAYGVFDNNPGETYTIDMVSTYLADHPEALVPEPVPLPPSKEEIARREEQSLLAYLASTDWYVVRFAETGEEVPNAVLVQRQSARDRVSELRSSI